MLLLLLVKTSIANLLESIAFATYQALVESDFPFTVLRTLKLVHYLCHRLMTAHKNTVTGHILPSSRKTIYKRGHSSMSPA